MSLVTGLAAGVSVEAAVIIGMAGLARRPRDGARIAFAVAALAAAAGAVAVVAMYSADSAESHAALTKWLLYPASTVWTVAVVWLVAFHTGVCPHRFLVTLTGAFAATLVVDLLLPLGLLHDAVGRLAPMDLAGAHAMDIAGVSPHPLHFITVALTAVAAAFLFYALAVVFRRGEHGKAAYLGVAVVLFSLSMLVDLLTDYGLIAGFYTTQIFFAGVVLVTSVVLRRQSLRDETELRRYRTELESLVAERVADLDSANAMLAEEARVRLATEEALRRRLTELDALQHLSRTLADRVSFSAALDMATAEVAELFGAHSAMVHLAIEEGPGQLGLAAPGRSSRTASATALEAFPLFKEAIDDRDVVVVADPARADLPPDLLERVTTEEACGLAVVPLVARGEVQGMLSIVYRDDDPPLAGNQARMARTVADALAVAVDNEWAHRRDTRDAATRERQHLARELHDAVTQTVYSATLIADALPEVWQRDPAEGLRGLATLRRLVHGALAEMRTLLFELRPGALRAAPLDALLERLGAALSGQIQVPVEVHVREDVAVPAEVKIALYRVAQEAFSNVAKHARAGSVSAMLTADAKGATLRVADDGRGFDPSEVSAERMGLRIMRERMDQIGASIAVDSAPDQGTTLVVVWPRKNVDASSPRTEEGDRE